MRSLIIISICIVFSFPVRCQDSIKVKYFSLVKELFRDIYENRFDERKIVIKNKLDSLTINRIVQEINKPLLTKETLQDYGRIKKDSFRLSVTERKFIILQIRAEDNNWLTQNFPNVSVVEITGSPINSKVTNLSGFIKPIFLRKGTLCLFYDDYSCGETCGYGHLTFFKKVKGKWIVFWRVYSWVS